MYNSLWFDNLNKPIFQPPEWIFMPIWIILYSTLFASLIIYTIKITQKPKLTGYILFTVHMIFNLLWSPVFFILHKIEIALFTIFIIDITAVLFIKKFLSVSKIAGMILIPYLFWILFATYLNFKIYILN